MRMRIRLLCMHSSCIYMYETKWYMFIFIHVCMNLVILIRRPMYVCTCVRIRFVYNCRPKGPSVSGTYECIDKT